MSRPIIECAKCGNRRPHRAHGWCNSCYMRWCRATRPKGCSACGRARPRVAHGWCQACYMRWTRADRPADGPPVPTRVDRDGIVACSACGQEREHAAHGWCHACYFRWYRAGRPAEGPPARQKAIPSTEEYDYRVSEYAHLMACGESQEQVIEQIGITVATARRYAKALQRVVA